MRKSFLFSAVVFCGLCAALAGCHEQAGVDLPDAATPPDLASPYPAVKPDTPQVTNAGGPVLTSPEVVVITFPGDSAVKDIEAMVSTVGATSYWHDAVSEYGVGALKVTKNIHVADAAPATTTDTEIQAWLGSMLDGSHAEWPAPTANTLYAIFYPATTTITQGDQQSCQSFGGYHNDTGVGGTNQRVAYAVLPRCTDPGMTTLEYLTSATSHELMEACEDPLPTTAPAYSQVDDAHFPWMRLLGGGETADLCAQNRNANFQPDGFAYFVQRNWSNAAAAAGKDPCVPAPTSSVYFNVTALTPGDDVVVNAQGFPFSTFGWNVPVGTSRTVELQLFSDAPTSGPWTLSATDLSGGRATGGTPPLALALDRTTGHNGDVVQLTITAKSAVTARSGADTILVSSSLAGVTHTWLATVSTSAATP